MCSKKKNSPIPVEPNTNLAYTRKVTVGHFAKRDNVLLKTVSTNINMYIKKRNPPPPHSHTPPPHPPPCPPPPPQSPPFLHHILILLILFLHTFLLLHSLPSCSSFLLSTPSLLHPPPPLYLPHPPLSPPSPQHNPLIIIFLLRFLLFPLRFLLFILLHPLQLRFLLFFSFSASSSSSAGGRTRGTPGPLRLSTLRTHICSRVELERSPNTWMSRRRTSHQEMENMMV